MAGSLILPIVDMSTGMTITFFNVEPIDKMTDPLEREVQYLVSKMYVVPVNELKNVKFLLYSKINLHYPKRLFFGRVDKSFRKIIRPQTSQWVT